MRNQTGFTLIELMVAVAVVAIIIAIAAPSYQGYRAKSIRTDECIKPMTKLAFEAEKYKGRENTYPSTVADMGLSATSSEGHYTFTIDVGTTGDIRTSYSASCVPTSADVDPTCGTMSLDNFGARSATGGADCWR